MSTIDPRNASNEQIAAALEACAFGMIPTRPVMLEAARRLKDAAGSARPLTAAERAKAYRDRHAKVTIRHENVTVRDGEGGKGGECVLDQTASVASEPKEEDKPKAHTPNSALLARHGASRNVTENVTGNYSRTCVGSDGRTPGFRRFLAAYPDGLKSPSSISLWLEMDLEPQADAIVAAVEAWKACEQWQRGIRCAMVTFMRDEKWKDTPPAARTDKAAAPGQRPETTWKPPEGGRRVSA